MTEAVVNLSPRFFFSEREKTLLEYGDLSATAFLFESGVEGLRLENQLGGLTMLPFQGQQIWSAVFNERDLTMKSMFSDPRRTHEYLENYGGFLLHCGATAMGVPSEHDTHPLHGELPNAPYQRASLIAGQDKHGPYLGLGGQYQHTVAFNHNYLAEPLVRVYAGSTLFRVSMAITNLKSVEMELMYMSHVNFRPVDHGRLVYSAHCTPENVRVRKSVPSHIRPRPGYTAFIEMLDRQPAIHNVLTPDLLFDPEVVFTVDYIADEQGWAHTMQVHPGGDADYLRHRPDQLDKGIRWISRTEDQDALGMVLPATAEPEGYLAEKAKGNLAVLPPHGRFHCELELGVLSAEEAERMEDKINRLLSG